MPYKRCNPTPVEEMFKERHPNHHTICENNRETYEIIRDLEINDEIKEDLLRRIRLNFAFGKRMHNQLKKYRWEKDHPEKNRTYEEEI